MRREVDIRQQEEELRTLADSILREAKHRGASAAEVSVSQDVGLTLKVRKGELETVEFNADRGFDITVHNGQRLGAASTSDSSEDAIRETVARALDIARHTQEDPCNGLADPALLAKRLPDLDLFHPSPLDTEAAMAAALACEAAGFSHDRRIVNSEGAEATTEQSCHVYANSHGFMGSYAGTSQSLSCMLIAKDDNGMQSDYWYSANRNPNALEAPEQIGRTAAQRAVAKLSPRQVATGEHPVLYCPQTARSLAGHLIRALSGGALYRKASFLLDSLGTEVASPHLRLSEQPLLPGRFGSTAFDGDGVATSEKAFIDAGTVRSYALSAYSGRRLGLPTTGNAGGVHNLRLEGATKPAEALFKEMGRGLYVTDLMGQGVNQVTGDYSRGAAGFWVENGEIQHPVHEVTIAANLKDLLHRIAATGDDHDQRGNIIAPSVLIERMTVAGSS